MPARPEFEDIELNFWRVSGRVSNITLSESPINGGFLQTFCADRRLRTCIVPAQNSIAEGLFLSAATVRFAAIAMSALGQSGRVRAPSHVR